MFTVSMLGKYVPWYCHETSKKYVLKYHLVAIFSVLLIFEIYNIVLFLVIAFIYNDDQLSFLDQQEMHPYYQGEVVNNQNNFHLDSSMPSHEENETTDVPSSPVAQTPTFDYYSNNNQQVRNLVLYTFLIWK